MTSTAAIIKLIIVIASSAYQINQTRKMRNRAKAAEEARKGFEIVTEGEIRTLPLVYGKALIGGVRAYHNTSSSFIYTSNAANKTFNTGAKPTTGGQYSYTVQNENGTETTYQSNYQGTVEGKLSQSINGSKNEFLYFQQALCQGPINSVYDVIINDGQFLSDPALGETYTNTVYRGGSFVTNNNRAAMRLDYFYNGGVDTLFSRNFNDRSTATFNNIAYLSGIIRLDRDEPQFNGVPNIQTLIEGKLIRKLNSSLVLGSYEYSNNPAWCLLDYLLDTNSGKGLSIDQIDKQSFYNAAQICDTIVQSNVAIGGNLYQPIDGSRNLTTRNLPLYECNVVLDVSKPIRENVEEILQTMGDARLVWSQGKYKLILQYPASNAAISIAATLTDDDIIHDKPIEISWPSSSDRLNNCTVKFNNECSNFKEESVSWPPKLNPLVASSQVIKRGIGGRKYDPISGWDATLNSASILNNYAVWSGGSTTANMSWKIIPPVTGIYTLTYAIDNLGTVTITQGGSTIASNSHNNWQTTKSFSFSLTANTEYTISISATDTQGDRGAGGILVAPDGTTIWTTRSESFSSIETITVNNTLYRSYLAEDNNIALESEVFVNGITDYYHALAKAEEIVRTSRSAISVKLQYLLKDRYLEPGDIIKINSKTLNLGVSSDFFLKISEVKMQEGAICEITGSRFDSSQLTWSSKANESVKAPNIYDFVLTAPQSLTFTAANNIVNNSPGTLTWSESNDPKVLGYILYFHKFQDLDSSGRPNFTEIGRVTKPPFYVPDLGSVVGVFGVRAYNLASTSNITVTSKTEVIKIDSPLKPPTPTGAVAATTGDFSQAVQITWTIPSVRTNTIEYVDHSLTKIYRAKVVPPANVGDPTPPLVFKEIGNSVTTTFTDNSPEFGDLVYKVKFISSRKLESDFSPNISVNLDQNNAISADTAVVYAYKRSTTVPTDNPGQCIYTFASRTITSPTDLANSWLRTIPTGTDPLYVSSAIAYNAATTDTILATDWSVPALLVGNNAIVTISPGTANFSKDTSNTISPANINLTANIQNISSPSYQWKKNGSNVGSNSATYTVLNTDFTNDLTNTYSVVVTGTINGVSNQTVTASAIVNRVDSGVQGLPAVSFEISKPGHIFQADSNGNISSYDGATATVTVRLGGADDSANWTYSTSVSTGVTINGANTRTVTVTGMTAETGSVSITASRSGYTSQTLIFSLAKARNGVPGVNAKTYVFTITGGNRTINYDANGANPSPAGGTYAVSLTEDGVAVTPSSYTWAVTGHLTASGSATASTYSPSLSSSFTNGLVNLIQCTVSYAGLTFSDTVAVVITKTGSSGVNATQAAVVSLYQWSSTQPGNPSGNSSYLWSSGSHSNYTGGNNWSTSISTNPGTPGVGLWVATKNVTDTATATSTSVSWASGYTVSLFSSNGTNGANATQTAEPKQYKWAITIPSKSATSTTYTWSNGAISSYSTGWYAKPEDDPAANSLGHTLWVATAKLIASATQQTSTFSWSTDSTTSALGYAGTNGQQGASYKTAYAKTDLAALASSPSTITTTGSGSFPAAGSWGATIGGANQTWSGTPPALTAGQSLYQADGIYNPVTDQIVWNVPYLSSLKVGSLSAISSDLGTITAGSINLQSGKAKINSDGTAEFKAISILNADGSVLLQSGGTLDYSKVSGTKPPSDATKGAPTGTLVGSTLAETVEANASDGNFAKGQLSNKLTKNGNDTLTGTVTLQTGGMVLVGTTTNGVYLSPNGLVGVKNGINQFVIQSDGTATFAGTLSAAAGSLGTIDLSSGAINAGSYVGVGWAWPTSFSSGFHLGPSGLLMGSAKVTNSAYVQIANTGYIEIGKAGPGAAGDAAFNGRTAYLSFDPNSGNLSIRGQVTATSGSFGNITIQSNNVRSSNYSADSAGFVLWDSGASEFNSVKIRGQINGGSFTSWDWPTSGSGFHLGPNGLKLGRYGATGSSPYVEIQTAGYIYIGTGQTSSLIFDPNATTKLSILGAVQATSGSFYGTITAASGTIAGINISSSQMYSTSYGNSGGTQGFAIMNNGYAEFMDIRVGSTSKYLRFDGSNLTLKDANLDLVGGSVSIKSSSNTSVSRMEITNTSIKVFDGSTLRVQLGNLSV